MVYYLLGEGEIVLKNGLSSIYLNKTPIVNDNVKHLVSSQTFSDVSLSGTTAIFDDGGIYRVGTWRPVRIRKAAAASTITASAGDANLVTSSSFFNINMLASATPAVGGLWQYIRIPGAGPDGTDYVGEVVEYTNTTHAKVDPPISTAVTGAAITFDFFTYAQITTGGLNLDTSSPLGGTFDIDIGAAGIETGNVSASALNYKTVRVSYRSGTLHQPPVVNMPGYSNASFGIAVGTELKQHTDYYGQKLILGKNTVTEYGVDGGSVDVTSDINLPATSDRVVVTISTAGMQASKATTGDTTGCGVTLQIWFDYKTEASLDWASQLMFGPTDAQVAAVISYAWDEKENPFGRTTGDIADNDPEPSDHEFSFNIDQYKPFTSFRIRIKRITPTNYKLGSFKHTNGTTVKSVQGFIEDKLAYPLSAYCALMYDSNEFEGKEPEAAFHCYGIPCWVPTNYITRLESDTGIAKYTRHLTSGVDTGNYVVWDGTFRKVYCDNPAWIIRTLILENRFGLGNWITADQINSYSFYAMARRCDELVPDGKGGLEPRFICGAWLTEAQEAYKVIKDFCSNMLAIPFWLDGSLSVEGDRPGEPVYTFTKGNIIGSAFSYESTGSKTRPNQIAVSFRDRDNFYAQDVEVVDDVEDMILKNRVISEDTIAFGATNRSQAIRYAKWKLLTSKLNREIISFRTGENAGFIRPGMVVAIQDADRYRIRNSGRIVASTVDSVTIDKPITIGPGTYTLHVLVAGPATYLSQAAATIGTVDYVKGDILPVYEEDDAANLVDDDGNAVVVTWSADMHLENRVINNSEGSGVTVLTFDTDFSAAPETEFVWALTNTIGSALVEGSAKLYRVLGLSEASTGVYSITAAEHFNTKFDTLDEEYLAEVSDLVPFNETIPPITKFTASISYRNTGASQDNSVSTRVATDVVLRWTPPQATAVNSTTTLYPNLSKYVLEYHDLIGNLVQVQLPKTAVSHTVENLPSGSYEFSLKVFTITGSVTTPIHTSILVRNDTDFGGTVNQRGLTRGGRFSSPPTLEGNTVRISDSYTFVSAAGDIIKIISGAPV